MKYKTLIYDMNRPVAQQITEPLNSVYGVAVKVYKDWQPVSADLSVGGVACTEGPGGWKLAELSSGNAETMKTVDVDVTKDPTLYKEFNPVGEVVNTSPRVKSVMIVVPLSAFFDSDITIKPEDVKVLSYKMRNAANTDEYPDEWTETQNMYFAAGKWMSFQTNDTRLLYCIQDDGNGHVNCWRYMDTGTFAYGEKTIPTSFGIWLFSGPIAPRTKIEYSAVIQINTKDGIQAKFQLYVQEQDFGYFEK